MPPGKVAPRADAGPGCAAGAGLSSGRPPRHKPPPDLPPAARRGHKHPGSTLARGRLLPKWEEGALPAGRHLCRVLACSEGNARRRVLLYGKEGRLWLPLNFQPGTTCKDKGPCSPPGAPYKAFLLGCVVVEGFPSWHKSSLNGKEFFNLKHKRGARPTSECLTGVEPN